MRILGIDPGYATTGFGVLHSSQGQLHLLNYGTITTPAGLTLSRRLVMLYDDMMELLSTVKPDAVAVEELFWGHNVTTGIGVSHGRAEKRQVMDMTRRILKMEKVARPDDAADAIAIALCHARSATSLLSRVQET